MVVACVAKCLKGKIQEAPWKREALMFKERKERIFSTGGVGEESGSIPGLWGRAPFFAGNSENGGRLIWEV